MTTEIILPAGTERVFVRDIPALFATAIHPVIANDEGDDFPTQETISPYLAWRMMWQETLQAYTNQVRFAVNLQHLWPFNAVTLLPAIGATGESLLSAFVTVKNLAEFAERNNIAVRIEQSAPAANITPPDDADYAEKLATLFDLVTATQLEKTFPADGKWTNWAERASRNGLKDAAKEGRGKFNPYKAAVWFVKQGIAGWDLARCYRVLANNLPARSLENKHLLTGNMD